MSLFNDQTVWVVKITLAKKDNSGTATYYLGHEYYDEGELYTSSPVIYPLLAGGIDSMQVERAIGREIAILTQPNIQIHGKACLDDYGKSFFDLGQTYSLQEAQVEFRQYWKPYDSTTTHVDATNIILSALRVKTVDWQGDTLQLGCKQLLFKDKEISKRFDETLFPSMPSDNYYGEYGSTVFGESVVILAPWISSSAMSQWTGAPAQIFTGWCATSHPMNAFTTLYGRNSENPSDVDWVPINIYAANAKFHGNQYETGNGDGDGAVGTSRAVVFSPGPNTAEMFYAVNFAVTRNALATSADGNLVIRVSRAPSYGAAGVYIDEQRLREVIFDIPNTASLFTGVAYLFPPLICTESENYLVEVFWSNPTATEYYRLRYLTAGSNANDNGQTRDNATRGAGWVTTANDNYIACYGLQKTATAWDDSNGTAPNLYSYYDFKNLPWNTLNPSFDSDNSDGKMHYGVDFKAKVNGIEDDGSGTYTGSASSVIKNAADIIRFLLIEDEIGVNHGSANVDTSAFDTARTKASSDGLNMSFAIDSETYASGLIPKILSQSRLILYLTRAGLVSIVYPVNMSTATSYQFKQGQLKDDMTLVGVSESSEDAILNDFLVPFAEDKLNTPKDPEVIRKLRGSSYKEVAYLNDSSASISDAGRIAKAAKSVAIYGRKLYRNALDLYGSGSSAPAKVMKYLFDRWHMKTTTVAIRVPSVDFNAAEILNDAYVSHENLPSSLGTGNDLNSHDSGTGLLWYYNGHPVRICGHGDLSGQIQAIRHVGDEIEFTIENVNPFEAA